MKTLMDQRLRSAKDAGIITDAQLSAILEINIAPNEPRHDDEPFLLFGGFSELLISIGLSIFLAGILFLSPFLLIPTAIALSYYYVKMRKLTLPGMVLIGFIFVAFWKIFIDIEGYDFSQNSVSLLSLSLLISMLLYYALFRLPFALFLIGVSAIFVEITTAPYFLAGKSFFEDVNGLSITLSSISGVVALFFALWYDRADLERVNVNNQKAFWLHVIAAPLLLWPFITSFMISQTPMTSFIAIIGIIVLALLGLVLDRRSFVTCGLVSFGALLVYFLSASLAGLSTVPLVIGAYALIVGTWWTSIRRGLFAMLPKGNWRNYVPVAR